MSGKNTAFINPKNRTTQRSQPFIVHDNDVLSGRGVNIAHHPGNERFRTLVTSRKDEAYCTTYSASEKRAVALEIIKHIQTLDPPGRFLKREGRGQVSRGLNGPWDELTERECIKKTCQALRDCNRSDRTGYAEGIVAPVDVLRNTATRNAHGLSGKQQAAASAAATAAAAAASLKRVRESNANHSNLIHLSNMNGSVTNTKGPPNGSCRPLPNGILGMEGNNMHLNGPPPAPSYISPSSTMNGNLNNPNINGTMGNAVGNAPAPGKIDGTNLINGQQSNFNNTRGWLNNQQCFEGDPSRAGSNSVLPNNLNYQPNPVLVNGNSNVSNNSNNTNINMNMNVNTNMNGNYSLPIIFPQAMQPSAPAPLPNINVNPVPVDMSIQGDNMFGVNPHSLPEHSQPLNIYGQNQSSFNCNISGPDSRSMPVSLSVPAPGPCPGPGPGPGPLSEPIIPGHITANALLSEPNPNLIVDSNQSPNANHDRLAALPINVNTNTNGNTNMTLKPLVTYDHAFQNVITGDYNSNIGAVNETSVVAEITPSGAGHTNMNVNMNPVDVGLGMGVSMHEGEHYNIDHINPTDIMGPEPVQLSNTPL